MPEIIEKIQLICSDVEDNHNKAWYGILYSDGTVETQWGRVGYAFQSRTFPHVGVSFLQRKKNEKLKKGYTELRVAESGKIIDSPNKSALLETVKNDLNIVSSSPLEKLIKQLIEANIHQITSSTRIAYNANTGLFSTPLGIVTPDGISDARVCLDIIAKCLTLRCPEKEFFNAVSRYLSIIPTNSGMKLDPYSIFPNIDSIAKQSNILDSLEASYKAISTQTNAEEPIKEKLFSAKVDILTDQAIQKRLHDWFHSSKKGMHGYGNVQIINIFEIDIAGMSRGFDVKLGNIREVFHGTSQANCLSILKSGLKVAPPSTAAIAGKMFGNGIYGAINSTKSLGYTFGRWGQGHGTTGWLFVCDFAMGRTYETRSACARPQNYDSVWAKAGASLYNDELIVYNDNQVNIKYLLECK